MYFKYGSYRHPDGEVGLIAHDVFANRTVRGHVLTLRNIMSLSLDVIADGQAAIKARIQQIETAYARDGYDAGFYHDNNARSSHGLLTANALNGVQVVQRPSFFDADGAEYATHRSGRITLQADYLPADAATLLDYRENVTFRGSGQNRKQLLVTDTGRPEQYILAQYTPQAVVQSGSATTRVSPYTAQPRFPRQWMDEEQSETSSETFIVEGLQLFVTTWAYVFYSPQPLSGGPVIV